MFTKGAVCLLWQFLITQTCELPSPQAEQPSIIKSLLTKQEQFMPTEMNRTVNCL